MIWKLIFLTGLKKLSTESIESCPLRPSPYNTTVSATPPSIRTPSSHNSTQSGSLPRSKTMIVTSGSKSMYRSVTNHSCSCYQQPSVCTMCLSRLVSLPIGQVESLSSSRIFLLNEHHDHLFTWWKKLAVERVNTSLMFYKSEKNVIMMIKIISSRLPKDTEAFTFVKYWTAWQYVTGLERFKSLNVDLFLYIKMKSTKI